MRHFLCSLILLIVFFYGCARHKSICPASELPDNDMIDEVISSVVMQDSLFNSFLGAKNYFFPYIYLKPEWTDTLIPPPPPLPVSGEYKLKYGYSFNDAFTYFNSIKNKDQRKKDSLFIKCQVDTTTQHFVSEKVSSLFEKEKDDHYWFALPIFSANKKTVIVTYSEEHFTGYITVLKRVNGDWVKVYHSKTWIQ
jgi:hypothetical protein